MSEKKPPPERGHWTDHFESAFVHGGGIVDDCDFCGRVHFDDDERAGDFEVGELERLRAQEAADPDKVIAHNDSVRRAECAGRSYVVGCPCNALVPYENFVWTHRREIAAYLQHRARELTHAAKLEHAVLGDLVNQVSI